MIRTYTDMVQFDTLEDRFEYLALRSSVGMATFGFDRWLNQQFYSSRIWKQVRNKVIVRDEGCDLGVDGYEIHSRVIIHHMNPIDAQQLVDGDESVFDPEFLICTTHNTHNAIHYGDRSLLPKEHKPRRMGDTKLW
jgi:hypothetical protein